MLRCYLFHMNRYFASFCGRRWTDFWFSNKKRLIKNSNCLENTVNYVHKSVHSLIRNTGMHTGQILNSNVK